MTAATRQRSETLLTMKDGNWPVNRPSPTMWVSKHRPGFVEFSVTAMNGRDGASVVLSEAQVEELVLFITGGAR